MEKEKLRETYYIDVSIDKRVFEFYAAIWGCSENALNLSLSDT